MGDPAGRTTDRDESHEVNADILRYENYVLLFFFLQNIVKENACKIRQQLRNIVDNFSSSFTDETHQLDYEILDNSNWLVINNLYIFILSVDSKFQLQYDFISLK